MGLETGTYISDLVTTNPVGASDVKGQGDDHLRLIKSVLKATFPNASRAWYLPETEAITSAETVVAADENTVYLANATSGAFTVTLPAVAGLPAGWRVSVIKTDSSANAVTIDGNASETINGAATIALNRQYEHVSLVTNGSAWFTEGWGLGTTAGPGLVELATTTEVLTGTDTARAVTPDALAALWEKGSNVASAGTISLGEGGFFHITGTTTITDIDFATPKDGRTAFVTFDDSLTLTHNGISLILPGGANITTSAGDRAIFVQDASDNVICINYVRASGKAVVPPAFSEVTSKPTTLSGYGITDAPTKVSSTTDNAIVRFDGTAGQQQNSAATIDDSGNLDANSFRSRSITLADDAATSFPSPSGVGCGIFLSGAFNTDSGLVWIRTTAGSAALLLAAGSAIAVTTGALAGTTGTDGKLTVSGHTDGNIYIENRIGITVSHGLTLFRR
jgi:hypothetical protein